MDRTLVENITKNWIFKSRRRHFRALAAAAKSQSLEEVDAEGGAEGEGAAEGEEALEDEEAAEDEGAAEGEHSGACNLSISLDGLSDLE